jgi:Icc protein
VLVQIQTNVLVMWIQRFQMLIAHLTDTHIDLGVPAAGSRINSLERVVDDINQLNPLPEVVIHTGDLAHNGTNEKYEIARKILDRLKPPFYVTVGNRDNRSLLKKHFLSSDLKNLNHPFVQYSVDDLSVRLISVDTVDQEANVGMGIYSDRRADDLKDLLLLDTVKKTILFMHHPPHEVSESKYNWQFNKEFGIDILSEVVKEHHQIAHVFCGHTHLISTGKLCHISSMSAPSLAVDLRQGRDGDAQKFWPAYLLHRIQDTGVTHEVRLIKNRR